MVESGGSPSTNDIVNAMNAGFSRHVQVNEIVVSSKA
jgi:hypothetical protein